MWANYIFLGIKYDAEKEEKSLQDIKQKELSRIEEALQKAAEKGTICLCFTHDLSQKAEKWYNMFMF